jgi:hypothetical protein
LSSPESGKRAEAEAGALEPSAEIIEAHGSFVQHIEAVLIVVTFAWLYVGVVNYLFASRPRQIKGARAKEKEIESRLGAAPP